MNNMRVKFNTALIVITHNLGVVARYADRVQVMYAGRIVEGGPTEVIYDEPKHPYTMGLISSVPRLDRPKKRGLKTIEGLPPNLVRLPKNICAFSPRCEFAIDRCREERPEVEEIEPGHVVACFRKDELGKMDRAI